MQLVSGEIEIVELFNTHFQSVFNNSENNDKLHYRYRDWKSFLISDKSIRRLQKRSAILT